MARKYTHVKVMETEICDAGSRKTRQEIADAMGLTEKQVKDWITRYNRRQAGKEEWKLKSIARSMSRSMWSFGIKSSMHTIVTCSRLASRFSPSILSTP